MKKLILSALVVLGLTTMSQASITGSAHDFASAASIAKYGNFSGGQICAPCHTPHNAIVKDSAGNDLGGPLWNHTLSQQGTSYTMYDSLNPKLDSNGNPVKDTNGNPVTTGNVDQNSVLCLSCHDGTVALDSFGGATGSTMITGDANLGTDLSNDHPIGERAVLKSVSYMVDQSLRDAANIMPARLMADGTTKVVGCTSCHEPHNRKSTPHMLWVANDVAGTTVDSRTVSGSLLCMNCHKK
jgi:hypothetical protein